MSSVETVFKFLGHIVTAEGLTTQPAIVKKVQEFGRPKDKTGVKSFLGLCNYYRGFLKSFAIKASPLNNLLKNGVPFVWTSECEEAFRTIQKGLVEPPLLVHPQIGGHFYVLSDASDKACGTALCHEVDGIKRPIVYYGYTFSKAEVNYTITEREALAIVKALKHFEDMLHGGKITILTDHQPLVVLLQNAAKAPSKRLKRWALALTDFDYDIVYTPGKTHYLPDFLSRVEVRPIIEEDNDRDSDDEFEPSVGCELLIGEEVKEKEGEEQEIENEEHEIEDEDQEIEDHEQKNVEEETDSEPEEAEEYEEMIANEITEEELIEGQGKDGTCADIIKYLTSGEVPDSKKLARSIVAQAEFMGVSEEGMLCKFQKPARPNCRDVADIDPRIVVPTPLVKRVLDLLHKDIFCGGHIGTTSLYNKLTKRFYWKNMMVDVLNYVRACERCALRKRAPHFKAPAKSWNRSSYPWEVVQTDFIGPLRKE